MSSYKPFLISMAPLSRKKKSVIVLVALRYCKLQGWGVHIRRDATKNTTEASQFPLLLPFYPFPFPVLSKEKQIEGKKTTNTPEAERERKETNDLLTPFSPGPDRQNGPSPACSRVTRNGPLQTRKTPPSFPLAVRRRGHICGGPKLPQHRKNPSPPGPPSASGTEPDIGRDQVTMRIHTRAEKKEGRERRAASQPKRRRHVRHFASFFSLSSKQTPRRRKRCVCLFSAWRLSFSLLKGPGDDDEIEDKKKKKRAKEGGERSGRIKIDKVSPFFFFFLARIAAMAPCLDGPDRPLPKNQKTNRRDKTTQTTKRGSEIKR